MTYGVRRCGIFNIQHLVENVRQFSFSRVLFSNNWFESFSCKFSIEKIIEQWKAFCQWIGNEIAKFKRWRKMRRKRKKSFKKVLYTQCKGLKWIEMMIENIDNFDVGAGASNAENNVNVWHSFIDESCLWLRLARSFALQKFLRKLKKVFKLKDDEVKP